MKASVTNYGLQDGMADSARRLASAVGRGLRAFRRLWGTFALDAAERHLHGLDERTLKDLGFDPRDLPMRDQLARCSSGTQMSNVRAALDYWR